MALSDDRIISLPKIVRNLPNIEKPKAKLLFASFQVSKSEFGNQTTSYQEALLSIESQ